MTNPYHPRVQQKLVHCRLTLQLLDSSPASERQTREALLQAAALHLAIGFRLYLRELASSLKLPDPEMVQQVADLQARKAAPGIVNELNALTFSADINALERQVLSPRINTGPVQQVIARDSGADQIAFSSESLWTWLKQLEALAERQRLAFVEW
ncbi:hypothetical protein G8764_01520 [Pseudomaricurvus alcaniphilus]|uniref:hypothetical protein n=1 Tax=Pseudomaricurvus alcaniphilus TaxID=1166482 RepID=UPI00140A9498|nr:hypothetical protein [Pseudomaricurvus alcaniphilus]NHN35970.1 hypothetical protein [Pseudomaricurvus alcaniphilus]